MFCAILFPKFRCIMLKGICLCFGSVRASYKIVGNISQRCSLSHESSHFTWPRLRQVSDIADVWYRTLAANRNRALGRGSVYFICIFISLLTSFLTRGQRLFGSPFAHTQYPAWNKPEEINAVYLYHVDWAALPHFNKL